MQREELNYNERLILNLIRFHGEIARNNLVDKSGLSFSSISNVTKRLLGSGFIIETGKDFSQGGGRPLILLSVNPDLAYFVGVDIGAYHTRFGVYDSSLKRKLTGEKILTRDLGDDKAGGLYRVIQSLLNKTGIDPSRVAGVGFGVSGIVDSASGVCLDIPNATGWEGIRLKDYFEERLGVLTTIEEGGRAMAVAEKWMGKARDALEFIFVAVGFSIVCGIVSGGELLRGHNNVAGLLGHTTVDEDMGRCTCGNYGCLENGVTFPTINVKFSAGIGKGEAMLDIVKELASGDKVAINICLQTGQLIGIALSNITNILNPELIILGGAVIERLEPVFEEARRTIMLRANRHALKDLKILKTSFGEDCGVLGAALNAANEFFGAPRFCDIVREGDMPRGSNGNGRSRGEGEETGLWG
ncbi:MAG: ROK family transcriptional regulator [Firmicutes bacterium]|nr:ROK family transcriptional regulator [Bacillota bacterium]